MNGSTLRPAWCRCAAVLASFTMVCSMAHAEDRLDFQVQGAVTPSCGLAVNRVRIDLGTVGASELGAVGDASRWRGTRFSGVDCVGATRASVTLRAAPHPADPRYIAPTGDDRGVAIEMRASGGQALPPDGTSEAVFTWPDGAPELDFEARYVRVGALKPGEAVATALVQIRWE